MRHALVLLALAPTFACASVIQPGFADPGGVHAPEAGSVTVAVHGGGLAEVGFPSLGAGGAVRVTKQLDDGFGFGGEAFGGGGRMSTHDVYFTPSPVVTGGARGFLDQRPSRNVLIRLGASASATTTATSKSISPVALLDAEIAIAPEDVDTLEPYAFAGATAGGMISQGTPLPLAGVHVGAGARVAVGDAWHVHGGGVVESRSVMLPEMLMGFISPTVIASVGVSHTF